MTLDLEFEKLERELKKRKPKKVLVQLPEGIKIHALEVAEKIQKLGIKVVFSGNTCWGGCSADPQEAKLVEADLIVHFGHAPFYEVNFPIIYVEIKDKINLIPLLKKSLSKIEKYKKIGIAYSVQHRHDLEKIKTFYEKNKKKIILPKKVGRAFYPGHVVGCEYGGLKLIQDQVDCFIIIGNRFHSLGASLAVKKPVFLLDVYNNEVSNMELFKEKIIKERIISIEKAKKAKVFGILIEVKPGQKFGNPDFLLEKFEGKGKKAILILMNEITPEKLMNFYHVDAFVELACPRIAVDDYAKYEKPILTYREALVILEEKSIEELIEKGFV